MLQRFPTNLRTLRKRQGLSHKELANQLGCTRAYISYLESGKRTPHPELLFTIADFFGITVDSLVRDELELDEQ